jgi:hypothetical protein
MPTFALRKTINNLIYKTNEKIARIEQADSTQECHA